MYLCIEEESAFGKCESEPRALEEDFRTPTGSRSPGAFAGTLANWCRPSVHSYSLFTSLESLVLHTTHLSCLSRGYCMLAASSCLSKSRLLPFPIGNHTVEGYYYWETAALQRSPPMVVDRALLRICSALIMMIAWVLAVTISWRLHLTK